MTAVFLAAVIAVWAAGVWGVFAAGCGLRMREVPWATAVWLTGGEQRRRLLRILESRAAKSRPPDVLDEYRRDRTAAGAALAKTRVRTVVWAVPGEPACDDPDCTGCQALRARRRHDPGCGAAGAVCASGPHVRTGSGWAGR